MTEGSGLGLYVHIPFCRRKCNYCDFASFPLPDRAQVEAYLSALKREIVLHAADSKDRTITTIYVGGGTPTVLPARDLAGIASEIHKYFRVLPGAEFTVETNPGVLRASDIDILAAAGMNRLSLGVQSLDSRLLTAMGRLHSVEDVQDTVRLAGERGILNLSLDLIYGLPGQDENVWQETVGEALNLGAQHLSVYGLTLSSGTPWGEACGRGVMDLPDQDACASMYETFRRNALARGYIQYEISNFAMPGYECLHNLGYWHRQPYLGLGLNAASFLKGYRTQNFRDFASYIESLGRDVLPLETCERISRREAMAEFMFLGLRTAGGVSGCGFKKEFGVEIDTVYGKEIEYLNKRGLLKAEGDIFRIPDGAYLLGNEIFLQFV